MFDFASYHRAATLADAINLLADNPQAKLLAGGTDVLIQLHHHNDRYRHIVDIHNLAELRGITLAEDGSLRIGSATLMAYHLFHRETACPYSPPESTLFYRWQKRQ